MSNRINLVLLYGGKSGEHEISLISAASVLSNLETSRYNIIPIGIDKEGRYFLNQYEELLAYPHSLPIVTANSTPLDSIVIDGRFAVKADVVFPVTHGPLYEDGCLQGLLELVGVAYVGCTVLSSAVGMDKDIARRLACVNGIKSARYRLLSWHASTEEVEQFCHEVAAEFGWPLFVKPCCMGSSVGIHKAKNKSELMAAIADAKQYDEEILVEEYIKGREIELAVLENSSPAHPPKVTLAGEICVNHADGFYSYTAKYLESEQTELHVPAKINEELLNRLQKSAAEIFVNLKCKGLARVDFFVNDETGDIYFNEINTLPGFTPISMYPKLWQASGLPYQALLDELINLALFHHECRQRLVTHYQ
ncbi:D-alanine--D-alanine ligase family protein [Legionella septentrionalis]|uniref:D-alanine--D-alanine ligase n=1 Tax=Legionella septentrionalis TaxID=2498109 RepID=A0A3S0V6B2_9GAMM|nr:D-alanine--D-alanine ligase family protein [Legionella septentrionalis]RUQ90380.1 D-alanine--D-alanine ligase [Legionella septentrionalis]RUR00031.1 D-alanine--D-alanine ligase [Legionella septentrionalis]RUR10727.1 D-alanine--D-alanine ligase [Legionella septentrionalis]RUR16520.1 D-alanine--D-alanine ligase [Legionella septentrionalis]